MTTEPAAPDRPTALFTGVAAHIGRYSDAVRVPAGHDQILVSGTPGLDESGSAPAAFADEARLAWRNVEAALAAGGATLGDIVSVRQWLTDAADIPAYVEVRKQVLQHQPAFMLGVVDGLVWPALRIEIEVVAAVPRDRPLPQRVTGA